MIKELLDEKGIDTMVYEHADLYMIIKNKIFDTMGVMNI